MSTVDITYFDGADRWTHLCPSEVITSEQVTISGSSTNSGAIPNNAEIACITANGADARVAFGSAPTCTTANSILIKSGEKIWKKVTPTHFVAVLAG